jgi:hypothetical protein
LIVTKLRQAKYSVGEIENLLNRAWFKDLFKQEHLLPSARAVEQAACISIEGDKQPPPLGDIFDEYRLRILKTPKATDFDAGVLHWVLFTGFSGLKGVVVDKKFHSKRGYLNVRWELDTKKSLFFAINESNVWNRWQAIVREFNQNKSSEASKGLTARAVSIWHSRMGEFGAASEKRINEGKPSFGVITLKDEEIAELYAGQSMAADIRQGDLQPYTEAELIKFLGTRLDKWKSRFYDDEDPPDPEPRPDPLMIKEILQKSRSLTWKVLERRLKERTKLTFKIEHVLVACQTLADDILIFSTPSNHLFLWQRRSG